MRAFIFVGLMIMAAPGYADSFGQRFGNEAPFALRDTLDPSTVIYIEPSAGAEDIADDQPEKIEGRIYPGEGISIEVRPEGRMKNIIDPPSSDN